MGRMIDDLELAGDDLGDAFGSPDRARLAKRFGATLQQADKLAALRLAQALRPARRSAMAQRLTTTRPGSFEPLADRAFAHTQCRGDLALGPTSLLQLPGAKSPPFAPALGFSVLVHAVEDSTPATTFTSLCSGQ